MKENVWVIEDPDEESDRRKTKRIMDEESLPECNPCVLLVVAAKKISPLE